MKKFLILPLAMALPFTCTGAWFTNSISSDSFVRAFAPDSNYGGAGALSVSGPDALNGSGVANGAFDTFIRVNTQAMAAHFDSSYGAGNWVIQTARLWLTETGAPNNALFNRGVGTFEIRWIANDDWVEGSGNPNNPTTDGITYNDVPGLLNAGTDVTLGTFTNTGLDGKAGFTLALVPELVADIAAGGETSLFITAIDPAIGFTFMSRNFGNADSRPYLEILAVPTPSITDIAIAGSEIVITAANGVSGQNYEILSTTNLSLPLSLWNSSGTKTLVSNGEFTFTLTEDAEAASEQFFLIRLH